MFNSNFTSDRCLINVNPKVFAVWDVLLAKFMPFNSSTTRSNDCPVSSVIYTVMGLLPDTWNCGLHIIRECREHFPRHRLQKETASKRSRHASRHVRHARAVLHVGIPNPILEKLHHGPIARYAKLRVAHAPGMPGTFSPPFPVHVQPAILRIW